MRDSVIDQAILSELRDTMGAEFAAELVDTFLEEAPGLLSELRRARADADSERFRRAAHSLKSNGNTFGALKLAAMARELELAGLSSDPACDVIAVDALDRMYALVATQLESMGDA